MKNYKTNSDASREREKAAEDKKLDPIVKSETKIKKKNVASKLLGLIINDNIEDIPRTIVHDIVVPVIKDSAYRMINDASYVLLNDGVRRTSRGISRTMYGSYYESESERYRPKAKTTSKPSYAKEQPRASQSFDNVLFTTRIDAEMVLESMFDILNQYDSVSIADFYERANIPNDNYTLTSYGWTELGTAKIVQTRDGYMIKLPKPIQLRRV